MPPIFNAKENSKLFLIAAELGMSSADVYKLHKQFKKSDIVHDNNLSVREFAVMHRFDNDAFASLIFSVFDFDKSGVINFEEFVLGLWSSLTLSDADLMAFTFRLFDRDNSGYLSTRELVKMLSIVCGNDKKGRSWRNNSSKKTAKTTME